MDWQWGSYSLRLLLVGILTFYSIRSYRRRRRRERRAAALGEFAPSRQSWVRSFDIIYEFVKAYRANAQLEFWRRHFHTYGNPANPWTFAMGGKSRRAIFTAEPENIKAILATQFEDFGKGKEMHEAWFDFLGNGIFTQDGQSWHEQRRLIRPQFIKDRLSNIQVFERHTRDLLPLLVRGNNGKAVDASKLFFRFTLDAATDFLFGKSVDSLLHEQAMFADSFDYIQRTQVAILSSGPFQSLFPRARFRREIKVMEDFIAPYIDKALQLSPEELDQISQSDTEYTFLHALAAHTRDPKFLRDQIASMLLAGRDTTACTLSWLVYELAVHPDILQRLRKEVINQVGPSRLPTYDDLKAMRYLQHAINETLRLYPVVPYNGRTALRDTTLPVGGGPDGDKPIGVLKHTVINYSTLVMQRREDLYPKADEKSALPFAPCDEFSPDRWDHWIPKSWQYIPFNGGPRICIGQQFALTEIAYTMTRILQHFDRLEYVGDGFPGLHAQIVLAPAKPVLVNFHEAAR